MYEQPVLMSKTHIDVNQQQAKTWFLSLSNYPERYQFDSHAGFTFTEGQFGERGARFQTEERFLGIRLTLKFELTDVAEDRFSFHLLAPVSGIWGSFELQPTHSGITSLTLSVGSDRRMNRWFLRLPLIREAVQRQIDREVAHIQQSMESLYKEETWAS